MATQPLPEFRSSATPIDAELLDDRAALPRTRQEPPSSTTRTFFHPLSGLAILGIDLAAFGADAPTGFLLTPLTSIGAFVVTFFVVYHFQSNHNEDLPRSAALKALLGAIAAGVPFPIAGTFVGVAILALSGLPMTTSRGK